MLFEDLPPQLAETIAVLDEQDRLASTGSRFGRARRLLLDDLIDSRQVDLERRSALGLAVDPDISLALLDDTEHGGETQPSSLPRLFRGEERLEDPGLRCPV